MTRLDTTPATDHDHHCEGCGRHVDPMGWSGDMAEPDPGRGAWCDTCSIITYCDICEASTLAAGNRSPEE